MRRHALIAWDRSDLTEHGQVEQTGYEFELCGYSHHWYHFLDMRTKGTSNYLPYLRLEVYVHHHLGDHSGTAYIHLILSL